jgi:hypothetical protein
MALLYGRGGRLTAKNGDFRPGQGELRKNWDDRWFVAREKHIGGSGGSLEPPGPLVWGGPGGNR